MTLIASGCVLAAIAATFLVREPSGRPLDEVSEELTAVSAPAGETATVPETTRP
ncbi:hypothetical protein [Streptomyces tremellae]|uniref:MFS transporter n=1 Tax=Streptomyces tremellae TaxID=1124239 RepID=A0ABP7FKV6_9ACTN